VDGGDCVHHSARRLLTMTPRLNTGISLQVCALKARNRAYPYVVVTQPIGTRNRPRQLLYVAGFFVRATSQAKPKTKARARYGGGRIS